MLLLVVVGPLNHLLASKLKPSFGQMSVGTSCRDPPSMPDTCELVDLLLKRQAKLHLPHDTRL